MTQLLTRKRCVPGGTLPTTYRPAASVRPVSAVPTTLTLTPVSGVPAAESVTVPVIDP